ncbi:ABC transporter permease [uncultured Clostridium sp.]|uniref:ABC transporter permease n=1 Tax=uncultured Clostridium sp. TaxID=59620 RepID=UPI0025F07988|nr:ABC transporter permease [uncultured Clostridium sp.]
MKEKNINSIQKFLGENVIIICCIIILLAMSCINSKIISGNNLLLILKQCSSIGCIAAALTLVLISGNWDLSVGSMVSLLAIVFIKFTNLFSKSMNISLAPVLAILVIIALSIVLSSINGIIVGYARLNSMIVTLGTMTCYQAITYLVTGSKETVKEDTTWFFNMASLNIAGIPVYTYLFILFVVVLIFVLGQTEMGRKIKMVGGGWEASRMSGIDPKKTVLSAYIWVGLASVMTALILVARQVTVNGNVGSGYEMDAVSAVIIGGTSIAGGKGSVLKTFIAIYIQTALFNGFTILGLSYYIQYIAQGIIILGVVIGTCIGQKGIIFPKKSKAVIKNEKTA